jgi:hypothetical protein
MSLETGDAGANMAPDISVRNGPDLSACAPFLAVSASQIHVRLGGVATVLASSSGVVTLNPTWIRAAQDGS